MSLTAQFRNLLGKRYKFKMVPKIAKTTGVTVWAKSAKDAVRIAELRNPTLFIIGDFHEYDSEEFHQPAS